MKKNIFADAAEEVQQHILRMRDLDFVQVLLLLSFANGMPSADDSALERGFSLSIAGVTVIPAGNPDLLPCNRWHKYAYHRQKRMPF